MKTYPALRYLPYYKLYCLLLSTISTNLFFIPSSIAQCMQPVCDKDGPGAFTAAFCAMGISGVTSVFQGYFINCGTQNVYSSGSLRVNGSLEVLSGNSLVIDASGNVHVYGNVYNAGTITVNGDLYFYGSQWINAAGAVVNGSGTIHYYQDRPAIGATVNSAARPNNGSDNGFPSGPNVQCLDGGNTSLSPDVVLTNSSDVLLEELTYTSISGSGLSIAAGNNDATFSGQVSFALDGTNLWLGDNNLILTSTGSLVQFNPMRYVVTNGTGTLTKQGLDAAQFIFPIGACANEVQPDYTPARVVDGSIGADDYSLRVQRSTSSPTTVPDVTAPSEGPNRYWLVNTTSFNMALILQHNKVTEGSDFASNSTSHYITRYVGAPSGSGATESLSNWDRTGTGASEPLGTLQSSGGTIAGSAILSRTINTGTLSTWYSKSYDHTTPLPIELLDFTATPVDNVKVLLKWQTVTEINNAYFSIQRSRDGTHWEAIGQEKGAGTSQTIQHYIHWDEQPFIGINYYRLEQFDANGSSSYSPFRSALITRKGDLVIHVYPNPTTQSIHILLDGGNPATSYRLQVFNVSGQVIKTLDGAFKADALQTLDLDGWAAGTYLLRIIDEQGSSTAILPFVKQ